MDEQTTGLTIKHVAAQTGISVQTLRAWERRYGVPAPARMPDNRYRLYNEKDIADVLWMKQRIQAGITPAQASALLRQQRARLVPADRAGVAANPMAQYASALEHSLLAADQPSVQAILDQTMALFQPEQVAAGIVQPALAVVGEQWHSGRLAVWQEHLASELIWKKLAAIRQAQAPLPETAPLVVAACAPEEEHEIGLLSFAISASRHGWRVAYLGRRTPLDDLVEFADRARPALVALSISTVVGLSHLVPLLDGTRCPPGTLVCGGRLIDQVPILRERMPGIVPDHRVLADLRLLPGLIPPASFWTPAPRLLAAAREIETARFRIVAEAGTRLAAMSKHQWIEEIDLGIANLLDTLICALAFDAPELAEVQGAWLAGLAGGRAIPSEWIDQAIEASRSAIGSANTETAELASPLIDRLNASRRACS